MQQFYPHTGPLDVTQLQATMQAIEIACGSVQVSFSLPPSLVIIILTLCLFAMSLYLSMRFHGERRK